MSELQTEKRHPPAPPAGGGPPTAAEKKRGRRAVLWTLLAVLVLGTAALLTYRSRTAQGATFRPGGAGGGGRRGGFGMAGPLPVVVTTAQKGTINIILEGLGTVTPLATITVTTQISGYLAEVKFTEGQLVKKGDILAVIDPRPYQVALEQAEGQLVQAQAQYKEAQIDLDRYQKLSTQDSISKQQVDAQQALVQQYEGMVKTNQAAVDNATLNLVYCHVTAPVTGRVGLRLVDQGNYVTPNSTSGLVLLTQMKPITVIFSLPEDDIPARPEAGPLEGDDPGRRLQPGRHGQARLRHPDDGRQHRRPHDRHLQAAGHLSQRRRGPVPQPVRQRLDAPRRRLRRDRDSDLRHRARPAGFVRLCRRDRQQGVGAAGDARRHRGREPGRHRG